MALMSVVETLRICQLVAVPRVSVPVRGARDIVFDLASRQNLSHFRKRLRRPREALLVARDVPLGWIASSRQKIRYAWNLRLLLNCPLTLLLPVLSALWNVNVGSSQIVESSSQSQ